MKLKSIILIIAIFCLSSCNVAFFASKNNLIKQKEGYLLLSSKYIKFIPIKIDTTANLAQNLRQHKLGTAFYLPSMPLAEITLLSLYNDSIYNQDYVGFKIIPVELEYREIRETNRFLKKAKSGTKQHRLKVDGEIFRYNIKNPTTGLYYINAFPLVKESVRNSVSVDE